MDTGVGVSHAMDALERAWNAGDAEAFGAMHTSTASYLAFDGTLMLGPNQIAAGHEPLFRGIMRGSKLVSWDRLIRFMGSDIAVVTQKGGIVMRWQGDQRRPSSKRVSANTTVLVRADNQWLIEAFQNTRYKPWARTLMGRLMTSAATPAPASAAK